MNRITNLDGTVKLSPVNTEREQIDYALAKLSELEDLEERLQCEIAVVFSALHSGIYYLAVRQEEATLQTRPNPRKPNQDNR
jgi:hypothetical protein